MGHIICAIPLISTIGMQIILSIYFYYLYAYIVRDTVIKSR